MPEEAQTFTVGPIAYMMHIAICASGIVIEVRK